MQKMIQRAQLAIDLPEQWRQEFATLLETERLMDALGIPIPAPECGGKPMPISRTAASIPEALEMVFWRCGKPIHVAKLKSAVSALREKQTTEQSVRTCLSRSDKFKRFKSNYFGLAEWPAGGPRA